MLTNMLRRHALINRVQLLTFVEMGKFSQLLNVLIGQLSIRLYVPSLVDIFCI